jgi:uncharacterized membrane protein YfcA
VTPTLEIALFVLAFCGAFVSGLVGVGGAIVMIPLLYYVPPLLGAGELPIKVVAGLVGAGGAFLVVPVLVGVLRLPMRLGIGTSLAMVGLSAVTGFLGKALTGQVPLWPALTVGLGSLTGAPLGSRVSRGLPVPVLRGVLAGIITLVMLRVWYDVIVP